MELHCEVVIILAGSCSKTKQVQSHHVFHSVFCTSMASVSLQILDLVTIQPPHFITKLGKILGFLQLHCHLGSPISSFLGTKSLQKYLKVTRFVKNLNISTTKLQILDLFYLTVVNVSVTFHSFGVPYTCFTIMGLKLAADTQ